MLLYWTSLNISNFPIFVKEIDWNCDKFEKILAWYFIEIVVCVCVTGFVAILIEIVISFMCLTEILAWQVFWPRKGKKKKKHKL